MAVSRPRPLLPPAVDLALFRRMADLATEGLYLVDVTGRFLYVNAQGLAQMGGYTMGELLSLGVCDICPDLTPEAFAANVEATAHGPMPRVESRTQRKDGSTFPAEVSSARVDVDGEIYMFGVARDVSERKAAETARKALAAQLLQTLEAERQRVARELHDDVGQALATVGILLDTLELEPGAVPANARSALTSTRATIRQITESLARIVREYHPAELLGLGLADTLRTHVRQLAERHRLSWRFTTVPVEGLLTPDQELQIYRVVQEALANTARHAQARAIDIAITQSPDHLCIRVHDDGEGFHPETPAEGIGLATMRERAMLLRATLTVTSAPNDGTTVELMVPLAPEQPYDGASSGRTTMRFVRSTLAPERPISLPPALDLEMFRQMADMASEAFELVDRHGRFVYVNDRVCTLTGYSREELLERSVSDINPDYPQPIWDQWANAAEGPVPTFTTRNRRRDGRMIPVEVSATPIDVDGDYYYFAVVRDISDRMEAEAAEKGFTRRLLHTLEAERQRVARELHDEVGQAIATVGVLLHTIESAPGATAASRELTTTHATIRQITESVARIVRDYHPAELLALGLEDTLRTHARLFTQRHGLALRLSTAAVDGVLSDEQALHLYRIVQEALANVAHHGRARRVGVRLGRHGTRVTASVSDDGVGFDPEAVRVGRLGLVTMRERAELIGATLAIRSRRGHGTEIRLSVPTEIARRHDA